MSRPTPAQCRIVDERDGRCCSVCGMSLTGVPASRHHRLMRSHESDPKRLHRASNLIDVCGSGTTGCHGWIHAHPDTAYRLGLLVHAWEDPEKTPMLRYAGMLGESQWVLLDDQGDVTAVDPEEWGQP